jgi:hypothetical protein
MSDTANILTAKAKEVFLDGFRDLLALTKDGPNGVFRRIAASLALDPQAQEDCLISVHIIDQPNEYARGVARDDFRNAMFVAICKSFLRVLRNGAIEFVSKLTPEAQEQLENIEIIAGERAPRPVEAPAPPPKSAAELLTEEVLTDWKRLPADKVRLKMNNRAYKAEFDRLMAADQLDSQCTTLTDGSAGFKR